VCVQSGSPGDYGSCEEVESGVYFTLEECQAAGCGQAPTTPPASTTLAPPE
jgi:hypothetical protein